MTQTPAPLGGTLQQWLDWQLGLHSSRIELGLSRVKAVAQRLVIMQPAHKVITVAGTNGKGSSVRLLETFLKGRGYQVGAYTSPHLWRYNERIRINGCEVSDAQICQAFEAVEQARQGIILTFFEYGTLAAFWLFSQAELDYAVLEIGLGGRLDAVNIVDADVGLLTNIGLDHADFLGDSREQVGFEKAGIMRKDQPIVCTDRDIPNSVLEKAKETGAYLYQIVKDFDLIGPCWHGWQGQTLDLGRTLPSSIFSDNWAGVLAVMRLLKLWPVQVDEINQAIQAQLSLPGRRETLEIDNKSVIFDVAHNTESAKLLANYLRDNPIQGQTHLILGMLKGKPVNKVVETLTAHFDSLCIVSLDKLTARGLSAKSLAEQLQDFNPVIMGTPQQALATILGKLESTDRVVVCGSFYTVANARPEV